MLVISDTCLCCKPRWSFLTKMLCFVLWVLGSLITCALMVSSLRLLPYFIYNKQVWLFYCSLSWQWYNFETSNLADETFFIMVSGRKWETRLECGTHNEAFLVMSVYKMFLLLFTSIGSQTLAQECAIYAVQW